MQMHTNPRYTYHLSNFIRNQQLIQKQIKYSNILTQLSNVFIISNL